MKHLVLLGAGTAHLQVLQVLAAEPLPAARVTWVVPGGRVIARALLADWIAGVREPAQVAIALPPIAAAAHADGVEAEVVALDAAARELQLEDGTALRYDALCLDLEPAIDRDALAGAREHALFVRPLAGFAALWNAVLALAAERSLCIVVIGGGALAVEVALALQGRFAERVRVSLVTGGGAPLADASPALQRVAQAALRRLNITVLCDAASAVTPTHVVLAGGGRLACDAPFVAVEGATPHWLAASGVTLDEAGRVAVGATLQSVSHPQVFAPGTAGEADARRAGRALALNLRRALAGGAMQPWRARPRALETLSTGTRRAAVAWRSVALEGAWVWHGKDWLDRRDFGRDGGSEVARAEGDHE